MKKLLILLFGLLSFSAADQIYAVDSLTEAEDKVMVDGNNQGSVAFQVTGTWVGTITFEATNMAARTTWVSALGFNNASGASATTTTANGIFIVTGTPRYIRARMSAYTSGTAIITAISSVAEAVNYMASSVTLGALAAGTNNIGDVDIASIAAGNTNIGDVDVASLPATPAGTNLIGRISASNETASIYNGSTALTPKFAIIDHATSGDNTVVSAVASNKIRVLGGMLISSGTVNVRFESGASGTALTGVINLVANSGFAIPYIPVGNFETAVNTLLNLELSGAVSVDGWIVYVEVP